MFPNCVTLPSPHRTVFPPPLPDHIVPQVVWTNKPRVPVDPTELVAPPRHAHPCPSLLIDWVRVPRPYTVDPPCPCHTHPLGPPKRDPTLPLDWVAPRPPRALTLFVPLNPWWLQMLRPSPPGAQTAGLSRCMTEVQLYKLLCFL